MPESKGPGGFLPFFFGVFSLGEPERQLCFPHTRRGPASMPPRSATTTMHNHTAAKSLSGTSGRNFDAYSYLSGLYILSNKKKQSCHFVLLSNICLRTLKFSWANVNSKLWNTAFRHRQSSVFVQKCQLEIVYPLRLWRFIWMCCGWQDFRRASRSRLPILIALRKEKPPQITKYLRWRRVEQQAGDNQAVRWWKVESHNLSSCWQTGIFPLGVTNWCRAPKKTFPQFEIVLQ